MLRHVHETWVYSQYLKACYVNDGLPPEKIHVIPLGVNPALFRPDAPPLAAIQAATGECFRFLFSGGATPRKGVDLLVNAYLAEFRTHEPVCLVIKDGGNYPPEMGRQIEAVAAHPGHARILYTRKSLNPQELAGLYTACHCYVHPYRSEGYGLPIAEAMACGLPVIVTGGGACLDFTSAHEVSYIPSTVRRLPERSFEGVPTVGNPYWLEPDLPSLRRLMRRAYTSYAELREKAILTSVRIRTGHTWVQSAAAVKARLFARL
jgi:glycosyltransferase involved in cell wall biosynthesis